MHLFLIKRDVSKDGEPDFDASHGFVIAADSEEEVRNLAAQYRDHASDSRHRDENVAVWHAATTTCVPIGIADPSVPRGVVLEDHQWG